MDGILNILKPPGMTSFDVVGYLRGILKTRKIGHTGTLDPGAVGVLPICVGNATKAIEFMTDKDKIYRAELTLGSSTDTQDSTGQILETRPVKVTHTQIETVMKEFVGKIKQIPPMYSAVKIEGKKLYELARSGITVEREPREIEIYYINIIHIELCNEGAPKRIIFDVACSKGTYIRTLCNDIGERLGCCGHMSFLIRVKAGNFDISSAVTLEKLSELANDGALGSIFISIDQVFEEYDKVVLDPINEKKFLNGMFIIINSEVYDTGQIVRVYDCEGKFLALGEFSLSKGNIVLKSRKLF